MTASENGKRGEGRETVPVGRSLEQRLLIYAAAASASFVAAQPAAAKVIYTPLNITISTGTVPLDLNHDGVVDFNLVGRRHLRGFEYSGTAVLSVNGAGNHGAGVLGHRYSASALPRDAGIGATGHFLEIKALGAAMADISVFSGGSAYCGGAFAGQRCDGVTDRFLGLRFMVNGNTYYGWAGFSVVSLGWELGRGPFVNAVLKGIAYQDVPGQPIYAGQLQGGMSMIEAAPHPQPATLGLLALGAPGLDLWRRRERM